ncbi:MAG: hypothetical protein JRH15_19170 [Deltaproteobacteria bacterium]|nr:hypothetical protein [Deltaproteobacteria bacterium]
MKFCFPIAFSLMAFFCGENRSFASERPPFTANELEKFIADWPDFFTWYKDKKPYKDRTFKGDVKITQVIDGVFFFKGIENHPEVVSYLDGKGWRSERFFYLMEQASNGLAYQHMKDEVPQQQASMRETVKSLRKDKHMPPAERERAVTDLEQAIVNLDQTLKSLQVSDEELALIVSHMETLKQLFDYRM